MAAARICGDVGETHGSLKGMKFHFTSFAPLLAEELKKTLAALDLKCYCFAEHLAVNPERPENDCDESHWHAAIWFRKQQNKAPQSLCALVGMGGPPAGHVKVIVGREQWDNAVNYIWKRGGDRTEHVGAQAMPQDDRFERDCTIVSRYATLELATRDPEGRAAIRRLGVPFCRLLVSGRPLRPRDPPARLLVWQEWMIQQLAGPPVPRRIWWTWSYARGTGKSTLAQTIFHRYRTTFGHSTTARTIGRTWDPTTHVVVFDLPFHQSLEDPELLKTLERFSDGGIMKSEMYECPLVEVRSHVLVLANQPPPLALGDRPVSVSADPSPAWEPPEVPPPLVPELPMAP